jgi:hypothetical protein
MFPVPTQSTPSRQLHSTRPALSDVPAIYFVSPSLPNIRRIAEDLNAGIYEAYHISFIEPLPRTLLEEFASLVARDGTGDNVEQVLDQYLSFVCPSSQLFSLLSPQSSTSTASTGTTDGANAAASSTAVSITPSSYYTLNAPSATEQTIEEEIDRIASGLFAVVVTFGQVSFSPRINRSHNHSRDHNLVHPTLSFAQSKPMTPLVSECS